MSKQPSNQTKRNLLRRGLAGILLLAMLFGLMPSGVFTARAASWADPYVETLVDWGVMRGDIGGNMAPDRSITRAEFVAMMNRAYGYSNLGGNPFTDVRVQDWYYEDIDIGYNIGYFKGTSPTTASPNDTLTREQAAVLLARNMMLQETVGETLGFSDSRELSEWSRGLVGAAAANGIISGYDDGSFQPFRDITRGEVAAMLVRAIGTPIQTEGEHALGNVYGNVTVNTSGVKLRDGVIVGNLYLTGGIDLGDVLLENVTVLGEIIVSGGGESNSSAASIIMRNVVADNMIVDSISDQFVTIRAEGNTDIPTTTVRTNAYVDDSSLPGFGLSLITLDGDEGTLLQLAGNIKEVWDRTPGSDLQLVQGTAEKITMDEKATGSSVLVDGDARVDDLNLDVATNVTGTGDIANLNVSAAGSTVEQLPDNITIRPGITADIAGSDMNSSQAAESSSDPKLLAGYPAVKSIAPTSATLVFKTNKTGTIYWAVSAVADGSVSEEDLLEPPVYGGNVLKSGTINATEANKEFTAAVTGLTRDGSYYVTAMLVDGRGEYSPIKVTSFSTPDDTVPAFNTGYPYMSRITTENAQVTVSTNKSCLLYYALLPKGSTAPTPAEFKANAVSGNLGYGTVDTVKNVTQPFQVNSTRLKELTDYTLYLWLTDYDGAKSSQVYSLNFKTPDEQPPVIVSAEPTNSTANSVDVTFSINEAATLYWAVVPEGMYEEVRFEGIDEEDWLPDEIADPEDAKLQIKIENGAGNSISSGRASVNAGYVNGKATVTGLNPTTYGTSTFTMYMVAKDAAGNYSKVQKITIRVKDTIRPTVTLEFDPANESNPKQPSVTANAQLVFSEKVKGASSSDDFETLYRKVDSSSGYEKADAMNEWAAALARYITLYYGAAGTSATADRNPVEPVVTECQYDETNDTFRFGTTVGGQFQASSDWMVNYCDATLSTDRDNRMIIEFPAYNEDTGRGALKLTSGTTYHFTVDGVIDTSEEANALNPDPTRLDFTVMAAQVELEQVSERPPVINRAVYKEQTIFTANDATTVPTLGQGNWPSDISGSGANTSAYWSTNAPQRIDLTFTLKKLFRSSDVDGSLCYDILFWADRNMEITLYSRPLNADGTVNSSAPWEWECVMTFMGVGTDNGGEASIFRSLNTQRRRADPAYQPDYLKDIQDREYAIHVDRLDQQNALSAIKQNWNDDISIRVSVVAGSDLTLDDLSKTGSNYHATYDSYVPGRGLSSIGDPDPFEKLIRFTREGAPSITNTRISNVTDSSADIGFTLDSSGKVNYVILRLRNVRFTPTGGSERTHTGATDAVDVSMIIEQITEPGKYDTEQVVTLDGKNYPAIEDGSGGVIIPPLGTTDGAVLDAPTWETVKNGYFGASNDVRKGTTSSVMSGRTAYIEGLSGWLQPNNIYFVLAVPEGETVDSCSKTVMCYYFYTQKASTPIITLASSSATDVTASVDRTSVVTSKLLVQNGLSNSSNTSFLLDPFNKWLSDDAPESVKKKYEADDTYTVLNALRDNCLDEVQNVNGDRPSVFDVYGSTEIKNTLVTLLTNPSTGDVVKDSWGGGSQGTITIPSNDTIASKSMTFSDRDLQTTAYYVCIAMARSSTSNTYGFRAAENLQVRNDTPPVITSVTSTITFDEDNGKVSGQIIILFDRQLWLAPTGLTRKPVTQSSGHVLTDDKADYYGLSTCFPSITSTDSALSILNSAYPSTIQTVTLNYELDTTRPTNISFPIVNLCNSWGTVMTGCTVTIPYDAETKMYSSTGTWK